MRLPVIVIVPELRMSPPAMEGPPLASMLQFVTVSVAPDG